MPLYALDDSIWFPPVNEALEDGLLAIGGNLSKERIIAAYRKGIFPWYDGEIPLWWSPDPRFILYPDELKVSKSMKGLLRKNAFHFTINSAFEEVIHQCRMVKRKDHDGSWINDDVERAYSSLNKEGIALSAESWNDGQLVGGLYGIKLGKIFFGESMFSLQSNASKFAFIKLVRHLQKEDIKLIDCQVYTEHLQSLGARMISRQTFISTIEQNLV